MVMDEHYDDDDDYDRMMMMIKVTMLVVVMIKANRVITDSPLRFLSKQIIATVQLCTAVLPIKQ